MTLNDWYRGRRVFVTGHTGFKGAWLTAWLRDAGAIVTGYSLAAPVSEPDLFHAADIASGITSIAGDLRDAPALQAALQASAPELVFHLGAQSLVRRSYRDPVDTFGANVMGTVHVLDAARRLPSLRALVVVTSDKCYENRNLARGYVEDDPMGGHDPYSASKGCAELVTASLRRSFFPDGAAAVGSARAGNVIGGGDWAEDRLIPDIVRAAAQGDACLIRNPAAQRPWQFVLEPLRGYLMLGRTLADRGQDFAQAWNFGPLDADAVPVRELVERMRGHWDRVRVHYAAAADGPHESLLLSLDCAKARAQLGWQPVLTLDESIAMTTEWYRAYYDDPASAPRMLERQLHDYARRVAAGEVAQ